MKEDKYFKANLDRWNELVEINAKSKTYDLEGFKAGKTSLFPIEIKELGNVSGKSLLHLQCHFGMDTLSWARMGAIATGVDFSENAIKLARELSKELNISAIFIQSNVYDIPKIINEKYDIVYTSYGAICWLPDLVKWAKIIDYCLKPGGTFYIIDGHPFGNLIDEKHKNAFQVGYNYFMDGEPYKWDESEAYSDPDAVVNNKISYDWFHTISEIINALLNVDFQLEFLHEFPFCFFRIHPDMKQRDDGYWELPSVKFSVPFIYSIKAHKKS